MTPSGRWVELTMSAIASLSPGRRTRAASLKAVALSGPALLLDGKSLDVGLAELDLPEPCAAAKRRRLSSCASVMSIPITRPPRS